MVRGHFLPSLLVSLTAHTGVLLKGRQLKIMGSFAVSADATNLRALVMLATDIGKATTAVLTLTTASTVALSGVTA